MTDEEYVRRAEFATYCRSVNGDLADLKLSVSNMDAKNEARHKEVMDHFDATLRSESDRRRVEAKELAETAAAATKELAEKVEKATKELAEKAEIATKEVAETAATATTKALETSQQNVKDALAGTMSRPYAIIITILTSVTLGSVGALLGHVLTHH